MSLNSNDQSQQSRVYADPINIYSLWLHETYVGADDVLIRPGDRVVSTMYGSGTVKSLGLLETEQVYVLFDNNKYFHLRASDLTHV